MSTLCWTYAQAKQIEHRGDPPECPRVYQGYLQRYSEAQSLTFFAVDGTFHLSIDNLAVSIAPLQPQRRRLSEYAIPKCVPFLLKLTKKQHHHASRRFSAFSHSTRDKRSQSSLYFLSLNMAMWMVTTSGVEHVEDDSIHWVHYSSIA